MSFPSFDVVENQENWNGDDIHLEWWMVLLRAE